MTKPWPVADDLEAELVPSSAAGSLRPHWDGLAARALEANPFYAGGLAGAALRHLDEGRRASLLLAWRGRGETRRLVGLLPLAPARGRHLNPFRVLRAASFYGALSTPLIDPDRPAETVAAMLAAAAQAGHVGLALPFLHGSGPVRAALDQATATGGCAAVQLEAHERPLLRTSLAAGAYLAAALPRRRRKDVERRRRHLNVEGSVSFALASSPEAVFPALESFLAVEDSGWKGRAGTSLLRARGAGAFIREAAEAGAQDGSFRVATLALDGRPIAAGLVLIAGRRAFYVKTAYDEQLARHSPGLLLTLELTAHLLNDPGIEDADSVAVAEHPMIAPIWTERLPIVSLLVATRADAGVLFAGAVAAERVREGAVAWLKARRPDRSR